MLGDFRLKFVDCTRNIGINMGNNMGINFWGINMGSTLCGNNMGNNFQVVLLVCGGLRLKILVENDHLKF